MHVGYAGVAHDAQPPGGKLFVPALIGLVRNCTIQPGTLFDPELPLPEVAEGYRAMDERRVIKTLLRP